MPDMRHMHANLMGTTGFERKPQQTGAQLSIGQREDLEDLVVCYRVSSIGRASDRDFGTVAGTAR